MFLVNPEVIFAYLTHHSDAITQWLCLATLLVVGTLVARTFFGRSTVASSPAWSGANDAEGLSRLEAALAKFTEQASRAAPSAGAAENSVESAGGVNAEVTTLKESLRLREEELAALRALAGGSSEGPSDLAKRFEELQAKLAEYEILEDDIADLSIYRDENVKLKKELEALKAAPPPPAPVKATEPAPLAPPEPAPAPQTPEAEAPAPPIPAAPSNAPISAVTAAAASAAEAASALMSDLDSVAPQPPPSPETAAKTPTEAAETSAVAAETSDAAAGTESAALTMASSPEPNDSNSVESSLDSEPNTEAVNEPAPEISDVSSAAAAAPEVTSMSDQAAPTGAGSEPEPVPAAPVVEASEPTAPGEPVPADDLFAEFALTTVAAAPLLPVNPTKPD